MTKFQEFRMYAGRMKGYYLFAVAVFLIGMLIGGKSELFHDYVKGQVEGLGDIAKQLMQGDHAQLRAFLFIFFNNAVKSVLIVYAGIAFGVLPLLFLTVNGMVMGFVIAQSAAGHENVWILIVKGILPHGIIELPAIIIACAFGMKLGILSVKRVGSLGKGEARTEMKRFFRISGPLCAVLTVALLAAAIIESTLTLWLVKG